MSGAVPVGFFAVKAKCYENRNILFKPCISFILRINSPLQEETCSHVIRNFSSCSIHFIQYHWQKDDCNSYH